MTAFDDAMAELVEALEAAGVPTTTDPDLLASTIAGRGACAYLHPPTVESRVLARGMRLNTEVDVLGMPPGGLLQIQAVFGVLGPAMDALTCRQAQPTTETVGGVTYPGYRLTATQTTPC